MHIYCTKSVASDDVEVRFTKLISHGYSCATDIKFEEFEEGAYCPPTMLITYSEAQRFMDELWNCGLRPSAGTGSAGDLSAIQQHLKDLQNINSKLLEKVLSNGTE